MALLSLRIVETENAVRHLDPPIQSLYRHQATAMIKQIAQTNYSNTIHKRHHNPIRDTRKVRQE
jgi:hypothetical protein